MNELFPPHAFVPGGPFRHPEPYIEDEPTQPIEDDDWRGARAYLDGFALFNAGYYWEAHEVWEGLWHAHGRRGPVADLVKGLIKLAAAGVKVRQGQLHGILTHARRAEACIESARRVCGRHLLGLDLDALREISRQIAAQNPADPARLALPVDKVFGFTVEPGR